MVGSMFWYFWFFEGGIFLNDDFRFCFFVVFILKRVLRCFFLLYICDRDDSNWLIWFGNKLILFLIVL